MMGDSQDSSRQSPQGDFDSLTLPLWAIVAFATDCARVVLRASSRKRSAVDARDHARTVYRAHAWLGEVCETAGGRGSISVGNRILDEMGSMDGGPDLWTVVCAVDTAIGALRDAPASEISLKANLAMDHAKAWLRRTGGERAEAQIEDLQSRYQASVASTLPSDDTPFPPLIKLTQFEKFVQYFADQDVAKGLSFSIASEGEPLVVYLDPGDAPQGLITELFLTLSALHESEGGSPLEVRKDECRALSGEGAI